MKKLVEMIDEFAWKKGKENPEMFKFGKLVEMEHVHNFPDMDKELVAEMIAIDHLKQNPNYYIKLYNAGLIDEKEAIKYYNDVIINLNNTANIEEK